MRRIIVALLVMLVGGVIMGSPASATSLQIRPAMYKDIVLKKGEKQKGYVDITNPTAEKQEVKLTVKRFKQVDSSGTLTFFDDETITSGLLLDLDNFVLNARDSIRVYFLLDSSKLPPGDIFASIFARTVPTNGVAAQSVQVGTLLAIVNGTPSSRTASVDISMNPVQIGREVTASIALTNTAPAGQATGYFPTLNVNVAPYASRTVKGPLVFAGVTRNVEYRQAGSFFGIAKVTVQTGAASDSQWIFVMTGYWRWLGPVLVFLLIIFSIFLWHFRYHLRRRSTRIRRP